MFAHGLVCLVPRLQRWEICVGGYLGLRSRTRSSPGGNLTGLAALAFVALVAFALQLLDHRFQKLFGFFGFG